MNDLQRTSTRGEVFSAINSERDYQDAQRGNSRRHEGEGPLTIGESILIIEKLTDDARAAWYKPDGNPAALELMRKIAASATHCMELHGAPLRS